ncbi:hypothetical protein [Dickeya chrysanthemi]|uniref:hypothetical protein n=1 Tax=Dickeya chrysanthemi TaxID=556 RepID=UPI0033417753
MLFLAGIRPTVKSSTIGLARVRRLHAAIREVLARAVERGGSTLRDFASADGSEGHFQLEAHVYGRHNEACRASTMRVWPVVDKATRARCIRSSLSVRGHSV